MSAPKRIQRRRTKGWRMPEGAMYVGRPTRWGNPYREGDAFMAFYPPLTLGLTISLFRGYASLQTCDWFAPLRGHDLACWCQLDQPCHANVLLELANR
jgi:hypothetical protein